MKYERMKFLLSRITLICVVVAGMSEGFPKITNPPVLVNAYLDTWVSFHCEGEGEILVWQTNGDQLTDEIKETRNITIHSSITTPGIVNSTLVIFAKPENNGLNIGCIIALNSSFVFDSAGADLFVRGITPVEDLEFNIIVNESSMVLWNSPSFVANDVIDLLYQVIITDNNTIVVNETTNDREYEVSIDKLNLCSIYTVTVTAHDEKYMYTSHSSIIREGYMGEYSASIVEKYIYVEESGNFMVVFEIMLIGRCRSFITGITKLNVPNGIDNQEMEHNTEYVEPEDDNVIFNYTVHDVAPQQNYTFECLIKDKLNTANDTEEFTTNHVQNVVVNPDNEVLHVLCEFAKNSNASGCGLNFTKREDTTVTLYSKWIVKNPDSDEAEGYMSLPNNIGGNLTVIAFDVLENEVSDKAAVIYNGLAEIKLVPATPIPTSTMTALLNSTYILPSSSLYLDSNIQSTAMVSNEVSVSPTTDMKSTKATNEFIIIMSVISGCVTCFMMIIIIIGILMFTKFQRKKEKEQERRGVCEVVSRIAPDNTYAELVGFERSTEIVEPDDPDHEHVDVFLGGHIPNPPSIPSQPPPLSQPPPPYCPSSPLIHPAVIQQTSSDTSLPNHRPSYRSQSSRSSEDDNLLCNDDIPEGLSNESPPNSDILLLHGHDLRTHRPSLTSQESTTSETPLIHSPRTLTSLPEHVDDDATDIFSYEPISNDSSETSISNDTPPSTSNESVEVPMMVRHSAPIPPVVVQSETTKNKHYAELQYPDNPPRVPPPCDTVVVYSQIPHYLQMKKPPKLSPLTSDQRYEVSLASEEMNSEASLLHTKSVSGPPKLPPRAPMNCVEGLESNVTKKHENLPPSYNDVMNSKESTPEYSTDCRPNGRPVYPVLNTHLPVGSEVVDHCIIQMPDIKEYHSDPYLASNQEGTSVVLPTKRDVCDIEMKLQGSRHGGMFVLPLSPQPKQYYTFGSFREETPISTVTLRQNEDLPEEENIFFGYCQCVDTCSESELVTSLRHIDIACVSSLVTCNVVHLDCEEENLVLTEEEDKVSEVISGEKNDDIVEEEHEEDEQYQHEHLRCLLSVMNSSEVCDLKLNPIAASFRFGKIKKVFEYLLFSKQALRRFNLTWNNDEVLLFLGCLFKTNATDVLHGLNLILDVLVTIGGYCLSQLNNATLYAECPPKVPAVQKTNQISALPTDTITRTNFSVPIPCEDGVGTYDIALENSVDKGGTFYTFDVLRANYSVGPGTVCVTCHYIRSSPASGCRLVVSNTGVNKDREVAVNIPQESDEGCVEVSSEGLYRVRVFDWNTNANFSEEPVIDVGVISVPPLIIPVPSTFTWCTLPTQTYVSQDHKYKSSKKIKVCRKALSEEELDVSSSRVLLLGAAGTGKTSLKCALTNSLLNIRSSLQPDVPLQPVSQEWEKVTPGDEIEEIAAIVHKIQEVCGISSTIIAAVNFLQQVTSVFLSAPQEHNPKKEQMMELEMFSLALMKATKMSQYNIELVKPQPFFHIWDCGGQPMFHDVLPAFLTSRTMLLLLFDASIDFNTRLKVVQYQQAKAKLDKCVEGSYHEHKDKIFLAIQKEIVIIDSTTSGRGIEEDIVYKYIRKFYGFTSKMVVIGTPIILFHNVLQSLVKTSESIITTMWDASPIGVPCNIMHKDIHSAFKLYFESGVVLRFCIKGTQDKVVLDPKWFVECLGKILTFPGSVSRLQSMFRDSTIPEIIDCCEDKNTEEEYEDEYKDEYEDNMKRNMRGM